MHPMMAWQNLICLTKQNLKKMKKQFFAAAVIAAMFTGTAAMAQDGKGLYLTPQDYVNKKTESQDKIKAEPLFQRSKVKTSKDGKAASFDKSEVYGYRDAKNQDYRFFGNEAYKIIDNDQFLLYSRLEHVQNGKERTKETRYYFSAEPGSAVLPLTKNNLKKAFPDNRPFHDLLDLQFSSDKELTAYDNFHKEYKVKTLYNNAGNKSLHAFNQ